SIRTGSPIFDRTKSSTRSSEHQGGSPARRGRVLSPARRSRCTRSASPISARARLPDGRRRTAYFMARPVTRNTRARGPALSRRRFGTERLMISSHIGSPPPGAAADDDSFMRRAVGWHKQRLGQDGRWLSEPAQPWDDVVMRRWIAALLAVAPIGLLSGDLLARGLDR